MLGALLRQSLRTFLRAPISQVITIFLIAVSASLLAVSLTLMMNLDRLSQRWGEGGEFLIVLSPGLELAQYQKLQKQVSLLDHVHHVTLRTPQDAQHDMSEALGSLENEISTSLQVFPGTLELSIQDPSDQKALAELRARILDIEGILELASMTDGGGLLAQLYSLRQALKSWLWVLGIWVGGSVAFVITQLVRLTLYQRQQELDIWITVGASEFLILGPLMMESATQTGLGAWVALELVNQAINHIKIDEINTLQLLDLELSPLPIWAQIAFILSAIVLGALASFRVARTSLRAKG